MLTQSIGLLKYWRYIATIGLTLGIAYNLHSVRVSWINSSHAVKLLDAQMKAEQACFEIQTKNNEASNAYQLRLKGIDSRHADAISRLLRHEANKCARASASGSDAAASEGLSTEARVGIVTSLGTCDRQAEQLEALQEWIR